MTIDLSRTAPVTPTRLARWAAEDRPAARALARSPDFWSTLVARSGLAVTAGRGEPGPRSGWLRPEAGARTQLREHLAAEGYARVPGLVDPARCDRLAAAILELCALGWDAAFVALVDEVWPLAHHLAVAVAGMLGGALAFHGELSAFCVDPSRPGARERGVPPHRDRPGSGSFTCEGQALPRHCTAWVSLTEATIANGCMHVVPASADSPAAARQAPLEPRRWALETSPGTVLAWSGQALHWGGTVDAASSRGPRVAVAISLTHRDLPSFGRLPGVHHGRLPTLAERLSLVTTLVRGLRPPAAGSAMDVVLGLLAEEA